MKILIAGEGGQGVQAIAEILAQAAFLENKHSTYIPNFGVEQRGGVSLAFVIVSDEPVIYPKFDKADILAILSDRSIERVKRYLDEKTRVILSPSVTINIEKALRVDSRELPAKVWNIIVLGEINREAKVVDKDNLIKAMDQRFERQFTKNLQIKTEDMEALG